jgi:hypothetical protein
MQIVTVTHVPGSRAMLAIGNLYNDTKIVAECPCVRARRGWNTTFGGVGNWATGEVTAGGRRAS